MAGVEQQLLTNDLLKSLVAAQTGGGLDNAANYIGKSVTAAWTATEFNDGKATWAYELGADADKTTLQVVDSKGVVVWEGAAPDKKSGLHTFSWDGKLKDGGTLKASPIDIVENPKAIKVRELEAATLPRVLSQVDLALINTNYALEAKLNPTQDALVIEGSDSPYVNILVARPDNKDSAAMQKLAKALNSAEVKAFIAEKYQGAVVPAF